MPRVKLFNEEDVLQKAIELFWKKGFSDTSMQDLVDYLGINRGSLYDTFGGKKELYDKAFCRYKEINNKMMIQFLESQPSVKEGLLKFFELPINASTCNSGTVRGCFAVNTTTELLPKDEKIHNILKENKIEIEKIFYEYLQKGVNNGEISEDKDINAISSLIYALLNGILVIGKINPDKKYLLNIVKTGLSVLD
jgi:TetR/AcrR family transcriptional repressor of nem operon